MPRKPDFFIVGAPKCGTTAMDHYLSQSNDIFMARKEMHHFGNDLHFRSNFYRRNREDYLLEFETTKECRMSGESSVWYLFSEQAAQELYDFNPQAKIIIMLRQPVEAIYSLYHTFRWDSNETIPTFEAALKAEEARSASKFRLARSTYFPQGLIYSQVIRYAQQVERYYRVFGRENVHVIIYDDFKADVRRTVKRTLEFLGADSESIPSQFKIVNDNKSVRIGALGSLMNDGLVRSMILSIRPKIPRSLFNAMQKTDAAIRKLNSAVQSRPEMSAELRGELCRRFAPEVDKLSALLGRDLSHWNQPIKRKTPGGSKSRSQKIYYLLEPRTGLFNEPSRNRGTSG